MTCTCGSAQPEATCCGPILAREAVPETAEALMRSRYTAFTRGDGAWLAETQTTEASAVELGAWGAAMTWLGLTVYATMAGGADDAAGTVSFVARLKDGAKPGVIHERSSFERRGDRWVYVSGVQPVVARNAACPCASGRKYKRCCGPLLG